MKKTSLINAPLSAVIARMGHGDHLVVADSGLPIPYGKELVDLAITPGLPRLLDVLKVILQELKVEEVIVTNEMEKRSPDFFNALNTLLNEELTGVPVRKISHEQFKKLTRETHNIAFARTGEATPFSNLILVAGVVF
ncbi:MAG: D-ribose pyranase [Calditrichia bacterium]